MKVLLIFILFSVATTGVLSDLKIGVEPFVRHFLYLPYRNVPTRLTGVSQYHAKHIFVMALLYPRMVTVTKTDLQFKMKKLGVIPWSAFIPIGVRSIMYYAHSDFMSVFFSMADYAKYKKKTVPVDEHPDMSIVQIIPNALEKFQQQYPKEYPPAILMYSYYLPCYECTKKLIKEISKFYDKIPVFFIFTKPSQNKKEAGESVLEEFDDYKVKHYETSRSGEEFSIEYIRQILP